MLEWWQLLQARLRTGYANAHRPTTHAHTHSHTQRHTGLLTFSHKHTLMHTAPARTCTHTQGLFCDSWEQTQTYNQNGNKAGQCRVPISTSRCSFSHQNTVEDEISKAELHTSCTQTQTLCDGGGGPTGRLVNNHKTGLSGRSIQSSEWGRGISRLTSLVTSRR